MKKFEFKSIRTRLIVWFLSISILSLFAVLSIIYNQRVTYIKDSTLIRLTAVRDLKVEQINNWLNERIIDVSMISNLYEIRKIEKNFFNEKEPLKEKEETINNTRELLSDLLAKNKNFIYFSIIDPISGHVIISTNKNVEGQSWAQDITFKELLNTKKVSIKDIYYDDINNKPAMHLLAPVFSLTDKDEITLVLSGEVNLETTLYELLHNRSGMGETGETLIVNKDVFALSDLRWVPDAPLKFKITGRPAILASEGKTGVIETYDYRGTPVLAAYTFMSLPGWGFVAKQDLSELYTSIDKLFRDFVIILIFFIIFVTIIGIFFSKTLADPVLEITSVAKKIEEGALSERSKLERQDELGILSSAINKTADALQSRIKAREQVSLFTASMVTSSDLQDFSNKIIRSLLDMTSSTGGAFYLKNEEGCFTPVYAMGLTPPASFNGKQLEGQFGESLVTGKISHIKDIPKDTIFTFKTILGTAVPKEIITIPLILKEKVDAIISIASLNEYSKEILEILNQIWPVMSTAFFNLIANEDIKKLAQELNLKNIELQSQGEELKNQSEELHRQNQELNIKKRQVEEANRMKSEFISNMSHELRTPLNSVIALSKVLLMQCREKISEEEANYLEVIERNGKQLLGLINDILDLSKIEAGRMDLRVKSFSIRTLIENICESLEAMAGQKGIIMSRNIPDNLPNIETDEIMLHKILQNLISNAVKFTEKGSVHIDLKHNNQEVIIDVIDTGIGISEKDIGYIFEEFKQVDGTTSRRYEGTGLGLSIALKTAKLLGGNISVKSQAGKGSAFTLRMPWKWKKDEYKDEYIPEEARKIEFITEKIDKKTILVVDDDYLIAKEIGDFLSSEGYSVITATSGREALRLAKIYRPFAITLDLLMPEMDGFEVLENLKKYEETSDIPVIIISISDQKHTAYALGAVGYITKPVDREILMKEIYKVTLSPKSVMIVDDNSIDRDGIRRILEEENILVYEADSGKTCLEKIKREFPDVLILDLIMPHIDGFEVIEKLRKDDYTRSIPVIVVTAKDLTPEEKIRLRSNVSSIIAKHDLSPKFLMEEIKRILSNIKSVRDDKKHILLIEDSEASIIQVKSILEREGYKVGVARGGQEGVDYLKNDIPDGIILDLMMPEVDGFDVIEKIRSTEETANIPVLILTAKDLTPEDFKRLKSNNIQQLIQKGDVDKEELIKKIRLLFEKKIVKTGSEKIKTDTVKTNILVVEDNPDNMITIKAILQNKYNIMEASDGEKGLEMAISKLPSLVLLDMALPVMDGFAVAKHMKNNEKTRHIPVIALTARAMKGDREAIIEAGCDDYISKPVDPEELTDKIKRWLHGKNTDY